MNNFDKILIGTHNKGKFKEISDLLPENLKKISPFSLNIESPIENGKTFTENSEIKSAKPVNINNGRRVNKKLTVKFFRNFII